MPLECSFLGKPVKIYPRLQDTHITLGLELGVNEFMNPCLKNEVCFCTADLGYELDNVGFEIWILQQTLSQKDLRDPS